MKHNNNRVELDVAKSPPLLAPAITDQRAWKRHELSLHNWRMSFPEACLSECADVARFLQQHPQPVEHLTPAMFSLPACAAAMARVREQLQAGAGFIVIDRLPVERYSTAQNNAIFWLLATMLGQVVHQKWGGARLYDVKDAGKALGYGVRRSITNLAQDFHTDGGWLALPPELVGLLCLQPAQAGGLNRCASLVTVHNELQRSNPDLLQRLYQPFWWDRQAEHAPHDAKSSWHPVYAYDGYALTARYYDDYVHQGYRLAGATLDARGAQALHAMRECLAAPANWVEFHLEQGQIFYVNNRQCAHARTAFFDTATSPTRRHLVRLWNRNAGSAHLDGQKVQ